jgi:hypothetical protein
VLFVAFFICCAAVVSPRMNRIACFFVLPPMYERTSYNICCVSCSHSFGATRKFFALDKMVVHSSGVELSQTTLETPLCDSRHFANWTEPRMEYLTQTHCYALGKHCHDFEQHIAAEEGVGGIWLRHDGSSRCGCPHPTGLGGNAFAGFLRTFKFSYGRFSR